MSSGDNAFVGRDVVIQYSLDQSTTVVPVGHVLLGAVRNFSFGPEWDDVDVTHTNSAGNSRSRLVTYLALDVATSGIIDNAAANNLAALESYVISPTNGQPCGWLKVIRPLSSTTTRTYDIPVIFKSFKVDGTYDDAVTWSIDAPSNGAVAVTDA